MIGAIGVPNVIDDGSPTPVDRWSDEGVLHFSVHTGCTSTDIAKVKAFYTPLGENFTLKRKNSVKIYAFTLPFQKKQTICT